LKDKPSTNIIKVSNPIHPSAVTSLRLNVNNVSTWFRTNGSFNRDPNTGNSGFEWPKGQNKFARYASGLWLGALINNNIHVAIADYSYEYLPGYVDVNGNPQGMNDPDYRIYNFSDNDTSDYGAWRTIASLQGAYLNNIGNPFRMGSQTMFYSYTDGYPSSHNNIAGSTAPLKVQILQTNWSYINVNLKDVVFTEYRIINRNSQTLNNFYISLWTDDDLGNSQNDAMGIDTADGFSLGYSYNYTSNDPIYGDAPPAVGTTILKGAVVPSIGDTVRYYNPPGSNNLIVLPNMKELKLSSFNTFINGDPAIGDPVNFNETYNNMQGLRRDGTPWINPNTNEISKFPFSGNPETSNGWIMTNGDDRRGIMNIGPIEMQPGDTQTVIIAQLIYAGESNLNSLQNLRLLAHQVHEVYQNNFQTLVGIENHSAEIPNEFVLHQNYPNPFNPSTKIKFEIPSSANGKSVFVKLTVYNSRGSEIKVLVNKKLDNGNYETEFNGAEFPSGVYFYKLDVEGFTRTKSMILLK